MEYILGVIVVALLALLAYRDRLFAATIKDLTLKLMARTVSDYTFLVNREEEKSNPLEKEELPTNDMMDLDDPDLSDEDLLNALKK